MKSRYAAIPDLITCNPPAPQAALASLPGRLACRLPEDYADFLAETDGIIADRFILYSCEDLPERNATFEVAEYAPGFVAIGDDNGGTAIMMRAGPGSSPVLIVGHGSMQPADMVQVADSLDAWLATGCPLSD